MTHNPDHTPVAIPSPSAGSNDRHRWLLALLPALILTASASSVSAGCCSASPGSTESYNEMMVRMKEHEATPEYQEQLQLKVILKKLGALGGFKYVGTLSEEEQRIFKTHFKLSFIK